MKKIIYFSSVILLLVFVACGKDEGLTLSDYKGKFSGNVNRTSYTTGPPLGIITTTSVDNYSIEIISITEDTLKTGTGFGSIFLRRATLDTKDYWAYNFSHKGDYIYKLNKNVKQIEIDLSSFNGGALPNNTTTGTIFPQ